MGEEYSTCCAVAVVDVCVENDVSQTLDLRGCVASRCLHFKLERIWLAASSTCMCTSNSLFGVKIILSLLMPNLSAFA